MLREEYLRRLVDEAFIDIYLAGNEGARIYWPWRLQPVHEATQSYRNSCEVFIVDSSFSKPNITNQDVLDKAEQLNAEYAVLADVYQDKDATVDALLDGLELYDDHAFGGGVIAPLQAPHDECYKEIEGEVDYVAIGGLKDAGSRKQISATRSVREYAGKSLSIHGLGFTLSSEDGAPNEWVQEIHTNPGLIDSIDTTAYIQRRIMGNRDIDMGEERRSVDCMAIAQALVRDLRRVSSYPDVETSHRQATLLG